MSCLMPTSLVRYLLPILAVFLLLTASHAHAAQLLVLTEQSPPLSFERGGKVVGVATEIFEEMCRRAGIDMAGDGVAIWPWARSYEEVKNRDNVVLYSMARTELRESLFQWVGPIIDLRCTLVARKRTRMTFEDYQQVVREYAIGTVRQSAPEQQLIKEGVNKALLHRVHDMTLNVKKLSEGRLDGLFFNEPAIFHTIKELGLDSNDYEVVHTLMQLPLYYAVSRGTDPDIVCKLQGALDAMKSDGAVDRIQAKYR